MYIVSLLFLLLLSWWYTTVYVTAPPAFLPVPGAVVIRRRSPSAAVVLPGRSLGASYPLSDLTGWRGCVSKGCPTPRDEGGRIILGLVFDNHLHVCPFLFYFIVSRDITRPSLFQGCGCAWYQMLRGKDELHVIYVVRLFFVFSFFFCRKTVAGYACPEVDESRASFVCTFHFLIVYYSQTIVEWRPKWYGLHYR